MQNCTFFVQLSCMVYFQYFFENLYFFLVLQWPKRKSANLFSLKIKSSEKQKCIHLLFLSKSKFFQRFRITQNQRKVI